METHEKFEFRGSAREWFGIWIVNLLLSIVTLGVYSAWAKVRSKKYFYQNTFVAGRNFDYHATGQQILIGRAIVVAALLVFALSAQFLPPLAAVLLIAYVAVFPVLLVRSLRFDARNSSWSNVRFDFVGKLGQLYLLIFVYPVLSILTLYTTWPFVQRAIQRYGINNHRLGTTSFHFDSKIGPFYMAFLAAVGIVLVGVALVAGVIFGQITSTTNEALFANPILLLNILLSYLVILLAVAFASVVYQAMIRNHIFAHTKLGENKHGFVSTVKPLSLLWIAVSNLIVVLFSLGLMLPWATVRMQRYLAENSALVPNGSLDDFTGDVLTETNAIGDAYSDIEGIELELPV